MSAKNCSKCKKPYNGFGDTCSICRKAASGKGAKGSASDCEECGSFFIGFGDKCPDCAAGRGLGRTGVRLPTPQEVDVVLDKIETSLKKFDASQGAKVRLRKVEADLLHQLEVVRDLMMRIVGSGDRILLRKTFVDCGRVARLRVYLDSISLSEVNAKDQRLRTVKTVCAVLEEMTASHLGLSGRLGETVKEVDSKVLMERLSVVLDPEKMSELIEQQDKLEMETRDTRVDTNGESDVSEDEEEEEDDSHFEAFKKNMRRLFDELDTDKDGKLRIEEMKRADVKLMSVLKACKISKRKHLVKLFRDGDTNKDGSLDFDEFLQYIVSLQGQMHSPKFDDETVGSVFRIMDKDGDGRITFEELKFAYAGILLRKGEKVNHKQVAKWATANFKKYDADGSSALDFHEFRRLLSHCDRLTPLVDQAKMIEC